MVPRYPLRDDTRTPAHMSGHIKQPAPTAGPASDLPGTSSARPPQWSRCPGPGIDGGTIPGGSRSRSPGRPASYTHIHTRQQANATPAQAHKRHTRPPHPTAGRHQARQATHPPAIPGPAGQHHPRQNPNARAQALRKRGIFHTPRTHARINSPAPAREKVLRARLRPLRVATPKIFVGNRQKNRFPDPPEIA